MLQIRNFKMNDHESSYCFITVYMDVQDKDKTVRKIELYSYNTLVLTVELPDKNGRNSFLCTGTYSRTTTKHIVWFFNQFGINVPIAVLKDFINKYEDIPIILSEDEVHRCEYTSEYYWDYARTMNLDSYAKRVRKAVEKWYW